MGIGYVFPTTFKYDSLQFSHLLQNETDYLNGCHFVSMAICYLRLHFNPHPIQSPQCQNGSVPFPATSYTFRVNFICSQSRIHAHCCAFLSNF